MDRARHHAISMSLIDHHRAIFLPYSEDKNLVMVLPNSPGNFFTSQIISGGEFIIAFDKTLHKYWVLTINQVYTPPKVGLVAIIVFATVMQLSKLIN